MSPLARILRLWRPEAAALVLGALLTLAALLAALALMANAGRYIAAAATGGLLLVPLLLQATGAARVILRYTERLFTHGAMFRALARIRIWFFLGLARASAGGLGYRRAGDVLARLVNDIETLDGLYLRILIPAACAMLLLPVLAYVLWRESSWAAGLILPLFALAAFILPLNAARLGRHNAARIAPAMAELRNTALDTLTGLREVKIFAAEGRQLAAMQSREATLLAAQRDLSQRSALLNTYGFLTAQAALLLALLCGATAPIAATVALFVLTAAFEAIAILPRAGVQYGQMRAAADRITQAAEAAPPVPDPRVPAPMPASTAIAFDHVSFRYAPHLPDVFENLNLQLPAHSRTAILGPSGAGKSTIASLLLKLAAPTAGQIRLGAVDIVSLPAEALRARIAYLSQSTHLFSDTIRNNLRLTNPEATDETLWAALDAARLADTIRALPDGISTWLGEAGNTLSGGQARRLALARTLLSPAPILILDEPCAGLDAGTEAEFLTTLNNTARDRTIILITHRLMGHEQLDRIWRLANGSLMAAMG